MKSAEAFQFKNDLQKMKEIIKPDFAFSKLIFYSDLIFSATLGWVTFILAVLLLTPQSVAFWSCLT